MELPTTTTVKTGELKEARTSLGQDTGETGNASGRRHTAGPLVVL